MIQRQEDKRMKRSEVRNHVFKIVFRAAFFPKEEWDEQVALYLEQEEGNLESVGKRAKQIMAHIEEIDAIIEKISEGWKIGRIGKAELAILRVAIFEIQKDDDIPVGVAINEAVELAKIYGTEKSAKFVNGLLAKLA